MGRLKKLIFIMLSAPHSLAPFKKFGSLFSLKITISLPSLRKAEVSRGVRDGAVILKKGPSLKPPSLRKGGGKRLKFKLKAPPEILTASDFTSFEDRMKIQAMDKKNFKNELRDMLAGKGKDGASLNRYLLILNSIAIVLFLFEPALPKGYSSHLAEVVCGIIFLIEYLARYWVSDKKTNFFFAPINLLDIVVIISLLAPVLLGNFGFLRIIRALRLFRTYRMFYTLKGQSGWFKKHENAVLSSINLFIFIFIMTDIVYIIEVNENSAINSYLDSLYFTLATLTTTGFGDITLSGTTGRMLSIFIMVFGITLFVKLARDLIRPPRAFFKCPDCGLTHHDSDASHCKHCGHVIKIETDGGTF